MPDQDYPIKYALIRSKLLVVRRALVGTHTMALDRAAWDEVEALVVEVGSIITALATSFAELQPTDAPSPLELLH